MTRDVSPDRQTVNLSEVAKVLGISRPVAYALAQRGDFPLPIIRLGRRMVVSKRALNALLDQTEVSDGTRGA